MATELTPITKVGPYVALPVVADSLRAPWVAADVAGNYWTVVARKKYLLEWRNNGTSIRTVTITSVADDLLRTGDVGPYSVAVEDDAQGDDFGHFYFSTTTGFKNGSNQIVVTASHADILFRLWELD